MKVRFLLYIESYLFFECIKFNKVEDAVYLINQDKKLLFDFDYFGQTCYHWAAKRNYHELLRELINFGKHVNLYDNKRRTPLFLAVENNHYESAKILLENNGNPYLKNVNNVQIISVCKDQKIKQLIDESEKIFSFVKSEDFYKKTVVNKFLNELNWLKKDKES